MSARELEDAFAASPLFAELAQIVERGDYSAFASDAKRHHFIPRVLLRGFSSDRGKVEVLFQLDVTSGTPTRITTEAAASRRNLYAVVGEDGTKSNRLEGFLSRVESHAAPALEVLLAQPETVSNPDRATLAYFFAVQSMRTPAAAAQILALANATLQILAGSEFSDRESFALRYREQFGEEAGDDEIEAFRVATIEDIREGRVTVEGREAALATGIRFAAERSVLIFDLDWTILRCIGAFITSDRAIAMHDPTPIYPWSSQGLFSSANAETTIPLDSDTCLLLRPLGRGTQTQEISDRDAARVNLRTYGWADRYIFGASQEVVVGVHRLAKTRPGDVIRPLPSHHVTLIDADPDDDSFAEANRRKGWPPRLQIEGAIHDYVVIPHDRPSPQLHALIDEAVEKRARKMLGVGEELPLPGRITVNPLHPLDLL